MAVKNFGVKQVNLIGASGTPTIESPNNININAVNVAISTDMSVGGSVGISSNITVTGIVTASSFSGDGSGLTGVASTDNIQTATSANFLSNVNIAGITTCQALTVSGNLTVDGTTTTINSTTLTVDDKTIVIASGAADSSAADGAGISIDGASATILYSHSGTKFVSNKPFEATSFVGDVTGTATNASGLTGTPDITVDDITAAQINVSGLTTTTNKVEVRSTDNTPGRVDLFCEVTNAHYARLQAPYHSTFSGNVVATLPTKSGNLLVGDSDTIDNNLNTSGIITATSFSGDGSALTSIPAGQLTGSLPAINGSNLTGVGSTDNIQTATKATFLSGVTVAGVTTTSSNVNVTGDVTVTGDVSATNFNSTSDVTLKQDVSVIDNALEMISQLEGVSWKWKESLKPSLGVTAQNVEEVAPELVSNGDHKSVNYNGLIGILIEAVKELKSEVDELKR